VRASDLEAEVESAADQIYALVSPRFTVRRGKKTQQHILFPGSGVGGRNESKRFVGWIGPAQMEQNVWAESGKHTGV